MGRNVKWGLLTAVAVAATAFAGSDWKGLEAAEAEFAVRAAPAQELPEGVTQAMVDAGAGVYSGPGGCMTCHGEEGAGTPIGPPLNDSDWTHIDGSYEAIVQNILEGVEAPEGYPIPMLPRGGTQISDDDVRAVAAYVWVISRGD